MKCLKRNMSEFYYALYDSREQLRDEYGNLTGSYRVIYKSPMKMCANVSTVNGNSSVEQFGNSVQCDKVIVTDDLDCPIDENTVLFLDCQPHYSKDGDPLFDYIVKKVARSLNSVSVAVSKVSVS